MKRHICKCCGAELKGKGSHNKSLCEVCRGVEGHYTEEYRKMRREEKEKKYIIKPTGLKEPRLDRKKCRTCLYRLRLWETDKLWRCGYCYYTGHKRPCEISSECSVYEPYKEKKGVE